MQHIEPTKVLHSNDVSEPLWLALAMLAMHRLQHFGDTSPQEVTNDLQIFVPIHWRFYHNNSCNRLLCPGFVLDFRILIVRQTPRVASCKLRNKSDVLVSVTCTGGMLQTHLPAFERIAV